MAQLSGPLQFYINHAADVGALWALGEKPDGVAPQEWDLFEEVLGELKSDADTLLRRLAAPLEAGLITGFSVVGKRPYKVRDNWDYFRQFKPNGRGNRGPVGYAGVQIVDKPGGPTFFVIYVSAFPFGKPNVPAGVDDRCPPELSDVLVDRRVVASVELRPNTDDEVLVTAVTDAARSIITVLGTLNP